MSLSMEMIADVAVPVGKKVVGASCTQRMCLRQTRTKPMRAIQIFMPDGTEILCFPDRPNSLGVLCWEGEGERPKTFEEIRDYVIEKTGKSPLEVVSHCAPPAGLLDLL